MTYDRFHAACRALDLKAELCVPLDATPRAELWTVHQGIEKSVLKIPRPEAGLSEEPAARMYRYWDGRAAVRLLDEADGALLLEYLDGPTLGDLAREGELTGADATLTLMADALAHATGPVPSPLPDLRHWCRALFDLDLTLVPEDVRPWFEQAQTMGDDLLKTAPDPVPLHGDLHHDNVIFTTRGPIAFDPKGVFGDPAYELANAFRNPRGLTDQLMDETRINSFSELGAERLGVGKNRILAWAAVKCCLSIAWMLPRATEGDLTFGYEVVRDFGERARKTYG